VTERRFPPPWSVEELDACYVVKDSAGQCSMKECPRSFAQICKDVWERTGDHRGDAEAEQQGGDAEKHSEENVGRGPHGFREHTKASPIQMSVKEMVV
jgi:hypothetical protein